ncbi:MAG: BON domain-containing protein [Alteromonadaceae bacterium]|jgi:hyperosmotically inducible protein|uniref:Transport-associated n=1 Tax=Paraglaciecola agarilytica NO2 TaxID=1125747 RepID=A0ABQ0IEC0_9ALTE|nr:BON domain-containing protein [Paraglaciecola agarilytica]MBN27258.1 BON domain-containing protein [Alteromonadaceae bacterium]GAC07747.1 transport-associated [Paraglaciecola agarilytica NO2]|tara:strand:+ start:45002 stop:45550 length:549 start_codon:yes stop_codon:yes gene_type:complete
MNKILRSFTLFTALSAASIGVHAGNYWTASAQDGWIDGYVEATLLLSGNLDASGIDTDVDDGTVTLRGKVETDVDKALAQELALGVEGVIGVENMLTVFSPGDNDDAAKQRKLTDEKVATVVKTRLLVAPNVTSADIDVNSTKGVVVLQGKVKNDAEKQRATEIATKASDVEKVVNKLSVSE